MKYLLFKDMNFVMRACSFSVKDFTRSISTRQTKVNMISDSLGINRTEGTNIFKSANIDFLESRDIQSRLIALKNAGFSNETICDHSELLCLPEYEIINQSMLAQEIGFLEHDLKPDLFLRFKKACSVPITYLKAYGFLSENADVVASLLRYWDIPDEYILPDVYSLSTVQAIYYQLCRYYMKARLGMTDFELNKVIGKRRKCNMISCRIVKKNLNIFCDEIGLKKNMIKHNWSILSVDPRHILSILNSMPRNEAQKIIKSCPSVVKKKEGEFREMNQRLNEFGASFDMIGKNASVYQLSSSQLEYRLRQMKVVPKLNVYMEHPRRLSLVTSQCIAKERLAIIAANNIRCYTLNMLVTSRCSFTKSISNGIDKCYTKDSTLYLSSKLNRPQSEINAWMGRHHYFSYIPIMTTKRTLEMLKNKGFTDDDIFYSIQILLYPRENVENALLVCSKGIKHPEGAIIATRRKYRLQAALYLLEKHHHFTGSGVWQANKEAQFTDIDPTLEMQTESFDSPKFKIVSPYESDSIFNECYSY